MEIDNQTAVLIAAMALSYYRDDTLLYVMTGIALIIYGTAKVIDSEWYGIFLILLGAYTLARGSSVIRRALKRG